MRRDDFKAGENAFGGDRRCSNETLMLIRNYRRLTASKRMSLKISHPDGAMSAVGDMNLTILPVRLLAEWSGG